MTFQKPLDYIPKTVPFKHQQDVFDASRDKKAFGLLMEQGTGKTKVIIDNAAWLYQQGQIDLLLVVAPNGVHRNWILNEVPAHMPDDVNVSAAWYSSSPTKTELKQFARVVDHSDGLRVLAMNIEALGSSLKAQELLKKLLLTFSCMLVVDESSTMKSPKANRTKVLLKYGPHSRYRRIMTGTPMTQSPLDLFTQFSFLDQTILRTSGYYAFRNRYAITREMKNNGRSFQQVVGYCNLDELQKLIAPHSYRVLKSECLDLPEKLYQKRYVELSPTQARLYKEFKKNLIVEFEGREMSAPLALTRLLRLQQIVGGFFQPDPDVVTREDGEDLLDIGTIEGKPFYTTASPQPIDDKNPRVASLIELLEETNGKAIIWARFRSEISEICKQITATFGAGSAVEYHGGVDNKSRADNVQRFQTDSTCRFFVGHVQAGGKGLTLHAASTVIYYSNDFSLENRLQSEDRAHRIGQTNHVTYIDFIAVNTLDEKVVKTLRDKKSLADLITQDPTIPWI